MKHKGFLTFCKAMIVTWILGTCAFVYFYPHMFYRGVSRNVIKRSLGLKHGGIPVNTLYAMPALASPTLSKSPLVRTGNRDTLYTVGGLDLSQGPQILHVPDMGDRYYSIELVDPWLNIIADVSRRTTGTQARDYLVTGPGWKGKLPDGMKRIIVSPNNSVLLLGRVLVESDSDLPTAYGLTRQIQLTPLTGNPLLLP